MASMLRERMASTWRTSARFRNSMRCLLASNASFTLVSPTEPTLIFKPPSAPSSAIRTFMASTLLMNPAQALA